MTCLARQERRRLAATAAGPAQNQGMPTLLKCGSSRYERHASTFFRGTCPASIVGLNACDTGSEAGAGGAAAGRQTAEVAELLST